VHDRKWRKSVRLMISIFVETPILLHPIHTRFRGFRKCPAKQTRAGLKICAYDAAPITRYYYLLLCLLGGLNSDRVCSHGSNLPIYQSRHIPTDDRNTILWYITYICTRDRSSIFRQPFFLYILYIYLAHLDILRHIIMVRMLINNNYSRYYWQSWIMQLRSSLRGGL